MKRNIFLGDSCAIKLIGSCERQWLKQGCEDQSEQVLENVPGQNLRILAVASVALEILSKRFRSNVQVAQLSAFGLWSSVLLDWPHTSMDLMI